MAELKIFAAICFKNKVEGLSHDQLAKKSSKGYKRHMEIHKSADKRIDPKKDGLTKLGRAAVRSAVAGAAAGGIKKKTSPLNNAYENPEFFTPTKSSYGQDMDNFFGTVNQAYEDRKFGKDPFSTLTDEELEKKGYKRV